MNGKTLAERAARLARSIMASDPDGDCERIAESGIELAGIVVDALADGEALRARVAELEASVPVFVNRPSRAGEGEVFVRGFECPDFYGRFRSDHPLEPGLEVITCSRCDKPAVQLDHSYPYEDRDTLCAEHVKVQRAEQREQMERDRADLRLGRMVRQMPPGWMLGHEGHVQRRMSGDGQLLPHIEEGAWRLAQVRIDHTESIHAVEAKPEDALEIGRRKWQEGAS